MSTISSSSSINPIADSPPTTPATEKPSSGDRTVSQSSPPPLYRDVLLSIYSFLKIPEACSASRVCHTWHLMRDLLERHADQPGASLDFLKNYPFLEEADLPELKVDSPRLSPPPTAKALIERRLLAQAKKREGSRNLVELCSKNSPFRRVQSDDSFFIGFGPSYLTPHFFLERLSLPFMGWVNIRLPIRLPIGLLIGPLKIEQRGDFGLNWDQKGNPIPGLDHSPYHLSLQEGKKFSWKGNEKGIFDFVTDSQGKIFYYEGQPFHYLKEGTKKIKMVNLIQKQQGSFQVSFSASSGLPICDQRGNPLPHLHKGKRDYYARNPETRTFRRIGTIEEGKFVLLIIKGHLLYNEQIREPIIYLLRGKKSYSTGKTEEGTFSPLLKKNKVEVVKKNGIPISVLKNGTRTYPDGTIEKGQFNLRSQSTKTFLVKGIRIHPNGSQTQVENTPKVR